MLKKNRFFIMSLLVSLAMHLYILGTGTFFLPDGGTAIEIPVTLLPESEVPKRAVPAMREKPVSMPATADSMPGKGIYKKGYKDILVKQYLAFVRDEVEKRRFSPPDARYYGLIGNVLVGFTIYGDGTFHDIVVLRSSGDRLLDTTAVNAVKYSSGLIKRPAWSGRQALRVSMTVKYQYSL